MTEVKRKKTEYENEFNSEEKKNFTIMHQKKKSESQAQEKLGEIDYSFPGAFNMLKINGSEIPRNEILTKKGEIFKEGCLEEASSETLKILLEVDFSLEEELRKKLLILAQKRQKISNLYIQRNFLMKDQAVLKNELKEMKIITKTRQENADQRLKKAKAKTEELEKYLQQCLKIKEKAIKSKEAMQNKIKEIKESIANEDDLFDKLNIKEDDITSDDKALSNKINDVNRGIMMAEVKLKEILERVEAYKSKKEEHNKNRIEIISHILTLKPYYKKMLILRDSKERKNRSNFVISNNRDNITINKINNYKFDFIISPISNRYEEKSVLKDPKYIYNELLNMLLAYVAQFNSSIEEKNYFFLMLSRTSTLDESFISLLKNVISHFTELKIMIKAILNNILINIDEPNDMENLKEKIKNVEKEQKIEGFSYAIYKENCNSRFEIFNINYNTDSVDKILFKLNEIGSTKRKKGKSKHGNYTGVIINELMSMNPYHSVLIIDVEEKDLLSETINKLLIETV